MNKYSSILYQKSQRARLWDQTDPSANKLIQSEKWLNLLESQGVNTSYLTHYNNKVVALLDEAFYKLGIKWVKMSWKLVLASSPYPVFLPTPSWRQQRPQRVIKIIINFIILLVCTLGVMWWEWHFTSVVFLPKTHDPSPITKKTVDKSQLRGIL